MTATIRTLRSGEHAACERILRALPDWFGIEEAIRDYVRAVQAMDTWLAEEGGAPVGFVSLHHHNPHSAEIHVMAVDRACHGRGIGRQLVEHAEAAARERGAEFLQVKTLGPSRPDPNYERTRGFYAQMGFRPLEENSLWGDTNPCLILVKHLSCAPRRG